MKAYTLYTELTDKLRAEGITIEPKANGRWYWQALGTLLTIVSFGQVDFWKSTTTTIGSFIGTPAAWNDYPYAVKYEILLHEAVHIRQYKKYGFGNAWIGLCVAGFAYLFLPFPVGIAWCRAKMEQAAYEESLRAIVRLQGADAAWRTKDYFVSQFTTVGYLWMWPFKSQVDSWFVAALTRIIEEENASSEQTRVS